MEQLCQAEHRHWTVRKSGSRPLWSDTLHARFLSLDTKGSVKLQVSPKNEVSIPVAKLAPWDVLYVEGIAGCCLDGLVARNSAPLFNEAEIKDLTRSATRGCSERTPPKDCKMKSMYLGFLGMSKEEEIAEIARVQKARRKERAASEKKMDGTVSCLGQR